MAALLHKNAFAGAVAKGTQSSSRRAAVVVRAQAPIEDLSRRAALSALVGVAGLAAGVSPSSAAFGDSANVFGRVTNQSGFVSYVGDGFALLLPSKWNPSKEREWPGVVVRYEDNFDAVNNLQVIASKTDKKSITEFGAPEAFIKNIDYLFGKQSFAGQTKSEGGFAADKVSAVALLAAYETKDKKGKPYYKYEFLSRTADGDEGGRHALVAATVGSDGLLYILRVQAGDKRWFKGTKVDAQGAFDSFTVA